MLRTIDAREVIERTFENLSCEAGGQRTDSPNSLLVEMYNYNWRIYLREQEIKIFSDEYPFVGPEVVVRSTVVDIEAGTSKFSDMLRPVLPRYSIWRRGRREFSRDFPTELANLITGFIQKRTLVPQEFTR